MWIKSQDGTSLLNVNGVQAGGNDIYGINPAATESSVTFMLIGNYGSVKETLEVLGQIEEHINNGAKGIFIMPQK